MKAFEVWFLADGPADAREISAVTPHGAAIELVRRAMEDDGEYDAWCRTVYVRNGQQWWSFKFGCEITADVVDHGEGAIR